MADTGDYLAQLVDSKAETFGSLSGLTSAKTTTNVLNKMMNTIKSLDGLDPDKESGSERVGAKDEDGKLKISYGVCEECGKELETPTKDGMCSFKCQLKHNMKFIVAEIKTLQDAKENFTGKLSNLASTISVLMSSISKMQVLLGEVKSLDFAPKYEAYFTLKIRTIIQYIQVKVVEALLSKNQKLINASETAKAGIDAASGQAMQALQSVQKAISAAQALLSQFQTLFDQLYKMITSVPPTMLYPESMHFGMTPRSALKLPGKLVNKLENYNQNDSISNVIFTEQIINIADNLFPPITEAEFVMPPEAFNIRKMFTKENVQSYQKFVNQLSKILKGPTEPLPKYRDIKLTNPQFLLFLLLSWGPQGLNHFAMPLYP